MYLIMNIFKFILVITKEKKTKEESSQNKSIVNGNQDIAFNGSTNP